MAEDLLIENMLNMVGTNSTVNINKNKLCSFCYMDPAILYCASCDRNSCQHCDNTWHNENRDRATHVRTDLPIHETDETDINKLFEEMCMSLIIEENMPRKISANTWDCPSCRYNNPIASGMCSICEETNPVSEQFANLDIEKEALHIIEISSTLHRVFPPGDLLSAATILALDETKDGTTSTNNWTRDYFTDHLSVLGKTMSAQLQKIIGIEPASFDEKEVVQLLVTSGLEDVVERGVTNRKLLAAKIASTLTECGVSSDDVHRAQAAVGMDYGATFRQLQKDLGRELRAALLTPRDDLVTKEDRLEYVKDTVAVDDTVSLEIRTRCALAEYQLRNWDQAQRFVRLANLAEVQDSNASYYSLHLAVTDCSDDESAKAFLCRACALCYTTSAMDQMETIPECSCEICSDCFKDWLTDCVRNKRPQFWVCPVCDKGDSPGLQSTFDHLQLLVQHRPELHHLCELFTGKLSSYSLSSFPGFVWCAHESCGNGFIAEGQSLKILCENCHNFTCKSCKKAWQAEHNNRTCEEFEAYLIASDPKFSHPLGEVGIVCPNCDHTYALSRGGCLHFTCKMCKYEFCSGCRGPFSHGAKCALNLPRCATMGLHAHHPRNCYSNLQDLSLDQLKAILKSANIDYSYSNEGFTVCSIVVTKETPSGDKDERCGEDVVELDMCRNHLKEYFVYRINRDRIDPITIYPLEKLRMMVVNDNILKTTPIKNPEESIDKYRQRLIQIIQTACPLVNLD